jgi:transcriptional regulator with XRE-family HTH domain
MPDGMAERIEMGVDRLGLTQARLANEAGLPNRQMVSRIKSGEVPGKKHLEAIARVLRCEVEWLVNGTGAAPSWSISGQVRSTLSVYGADMQPVQVVAAGAEPSLLEVNRSLAEENRRLRAENEKLKRGVADAAAQIAEYVAIEAARQQKPPPGQVG